MQLACPDASGYDTHTLAPPPHLPSLSWQEAVATARLHLPSLLCCVLAPAALQLLLQRRGTLRDLRSAPAAGLLAAGAVAMAAGAVPPAAAAAGAAATAAAVPAASAEVAGVQAVEVAGGGQQAAIALATPAAGASAALLAAASLAAAGAVGGEVGPLVSSSLPRRPSLPPPGDLPCPAGPSSAAGSSAASKGGGREAGAGWQLAGSQEAGDVAQQPDAGLDAAPDDISSSDQMPAPATSSAAAAAAATAGAAPSSSSSSQRETAPPAAASPGAPAHSPHFGQLLRCSRQPIAVTASAILASQQLPPVAGDERALVYASPNETLTLGFKVYQQARGTAQPGVAAGAAGEAAGAAGQAAHGAEEAAGAAGEAAEGAREGAWVATAAVTRASIELAGEGTLKQRRGGPAKEYPGSFDRAAMHAPELQAQIQAGLCCTLTLSAPLTPHAQSALPTAACAALPVALQAPRLLPTCCSSRTRL